MLQEEVDNVKSKLNLSGLRHYKEITRYSVYFLVDGDEIVYVGATNNLGTRLNGHTDKRYTDVYYKTFPKTAKIAEIEQRYIRRLKPKYNIVHNPVNSVERRYKNLYLQA